MNKLLREIILPSGLTFQQIQGDITLANVEVIVNPANSQLMHGGGLAAIIARKAGPVLDSESKSWIREHGPVSHGVPAYTNAGDLPFKQIIHAVGPVWGSGEERAKLRDAVQGSLQLAHDLQLKSLAIPAISTGVFGFPVEPAAKVILSAIIDFTESNPDSCLETVQLFVYSDQAAAVFSAAWDQVLI